MRRPASHWRCPSTIALAWSNSQACEIIGIGRPICYVLDDCGHRLLEHHSDLPAIEHELRIAREALGAGVDDHAHKTAESFGQLGWFCLQLIRLGKGLEPDLGMSTLDALAGYEQNEIAALQRWQRPS